MKPPRIIRHVSSPDDDEGEVFGEMGWRVEFGRLDGKLVVQIERPDELLRRTAFQRIRLLRMGLWNETLNEPAPEVRAIVLARSLCKAAKCTEEELSEFLQGTKIGARAFLTRSFKRTPKGTREGLVAFR